MNSFFYLKPCFLLSLVSLELTYNRIDIARAGRSLPIGNRYLGYVGNI